MRGVVAPLVLWPGAALAVPEPAPALVVAPATALPRAVIAGEAVNAEEQAAGGKYHRSCRGRAAPREVTAVPLPGELLDLREVGGEGVTGREPVQVATELRLLRGVHSVDSLLSR